MKNFTKILAFMLVAVMAVACFAACGDDTAANTTAADATDDAVVDTTAADDANTEAKVYKIASDNAFPPFESLDLASGKYVGIDMDIMAAVAEDQGFEYTMDNVGFDAALNQVQANQADGVIAGMTITDVRKETFDFSEGYFADGQVMVVAADSDIDSMEDLAGKVVATKAGTMGTEYAEANKETYGYTTILYEGSVEMYQAVMQGTCVACFEDRAVIGDAISSGNVTLKTVGEVINPSNYGFAVKKGENAELLAMFNAGLANIKENGKYAEILANYGITAE